MNVTATNKATGEVIEMPVNNSKEIVDAWRLAMEYVKTAEALKEQLKKLVPKYISDKGTSEVVNGYMFRMNSIQRSNYDKAVMRRVLDADTFDTLLKPDKTLIDKYLKENLETLGTASTELRTTMLPEGSPYSVIVLQRVDSYPDMVK
jgi:hypothetical protein